jgi:hypothetical protein
MTQQYLRRVSVKVSSATRTWDFANFRVKFEVRRGDMQTPNSCDVRIYNASGNTADKLSAVPLISPDNSEFTTLEVSAGYGPPLDAEGNQVPGTDPGNSARIFSGSIVQVRAGRESQLDTYIDITAADGDHAYNFATINASRASRDPGGVAALLLNALKTFGIQGAASVPDFNQPQFTGTPLPVTRGRTFYGSVKDELRDFAENNNLVYSLQDSTLQFIAMNALETETAIVVGAGTGMIGTPEQTPNGLIIRTLLNPAIKACSLIKLDATVNRYRFPLDYTSSASNLLTAMQNKISDSGLYYVMYVEHEGDTRGQAWYTTATCLAVDAHLVDIDLTGALRVGPRASTIPGVTR